MTITVKNFNELAVRIHASNVAAGWWSNPRTGESIIETRNRAELLMLTVSELSEASEGFDWQKLDDHLPQYEMYAVELADTAIRLFDQIGSMDAWYQDVESYTPRVREWVARTDPMFNNWIVYCVNQLSSAMEHHRKGRTVEYGLSLCHATVAVFCFADEYDVPILEIIEAKVAYNKQRADHKIENRIKPGGKEY